MSKTRENILNRLRQQSVSHLENTSHRAVIHTWPKHERIALFRKMLEKVRAEVIQTSEDVYLKDLTQLLIERGFKTVLVGNTSLGETIEKSSSESFAVQRYLTPIEQWKPTLFNDIDISITGCKGGIAESGSLILWPDQNEPRLMSLVPPAHLVVMHADNLYNTFGEAMQEQQWAKQMPTNALLISGPSKTADIEQTLAYGIHGPKQLIVLIVS